MRNRSTKSLIFGALAFLLASTPAFSQTPEERFELGNKAYEAGKFEEAVKEYEVLAQTGHRSANLYYNLGDAWYRLKEPGKAILNFERALVLDPSHPEAAANLKFVRKEVGSFSADKPWWMQNLELVGVDRLPWLASVFFWLGSFFFVFGFYRFTNRRLLWHSSGSIAWLLSFAFASGLWLFARQNGVVDAGIVIAPKVSARIAPTETANPAGGIPIGTRVRLITERNSWVYVEMPDQKTRGWIPAGAVETIRLPETDS